MCFGLLWAGSWKAQAADHQPEGQELIFADGFEDGTFFQWTGAEFGASDQAPPEPFLESPEGPAIYNVDNTSISLGYFDMDSGIELTSLWLELDGVDLLPGCTVDGESATCPSGSLTLRGHDISASIWDQAGNRTLGT